MALFSFGDIFQIIMYSIHRMVEVGRDLWRSSGPTSLLKQGHLKLVAQDHVQMDFEDLQGWRLHNLSGQPVLMLSHSHSKKSVSLCSGGTFCVSPSGSVTEHHWK